MDKKTFIKYPTSGDIWDLRENPGHRQIYYFKVPLKVSNSFPGGTIELDEDEYISPIEMDTSWQNVHTIEASDQEYGGITFTFTAWADGPSTNPRSIDIGTSDSCATNYSYTANFSKEIPVPGSFNVGEQDDHPHITWTAIDEILIDGYEIQRNYDSGGWEVAKIITSSSTNNWTDNEIYYELGRDPISYRMRTIDWEDDKSDFTNAEGIKGYWLVEPFDNNEIESLLSFELKPNIPNPFNPTTTIGYSLASESQVKLTIYNLLGKRVRTLVDGRKSRGAYSVIWDSRDAHGRILPAGIYIYRIEAVPISGEDRKPFVSSRKLLLAK